MATGTGDGKAPSARRTAPPVDSTARLNATRTQRRTTDTPADYGVQQQQRHVPGGRVPVAQQQEEAAVVSARRMTTRSARRRANIGTTGTGDTNATTDVDQQQQAAAPSHGGTASTRHIRTQRRSGSDTNARASDGDVTKDTSDKATDDKSMRLPAPQPQQAQAQPQHTQRASWLNPQSARVLTAGVATAAATVDAGHGDQQQQQQQDSVHSDVDPHNMLSELVYYHGLLPCEDVEAMLRREGDFVLRRTEHDQVGECAVISVRWKKRARHVVLRNNGKHWYIASNNHTHHKAKTVRALVKHYRQKKLAVAMGGALLERPIERQDWQLTHKQIELGAKIGEGAFGTVHKGTIKLHDDKKRQCAVKMLRSTMDGLNTKEMRRQFITEARIMRKYSHANIVRLYGVAAQHMPIMIVMEYAPRGSLLDYLTKRRGKVTVADHSRYCVEAAHGLCYLESQRCLHRDVAARNCLLGAKHEVKISDFGLSMEVTSTGTGTGAGGSRKANGDKAGANVPRPIKWLAPEVLEHDLYTHASDVWAYGVLMWEVFSDGREPYPNMSNMDVVRKIISKQYHMTPPLGAPEHMCSLMLSCWAHDKSGRPTFSAIVAMLGHKQ